MARRAKKQARRNGGNGMPGWVWLLVGLLGGVVVAGYLIIRSGWSGGADLLPRPDPQAQPPVATTAPEPEVAPESRRPKYEFYDVLRDKEVEIPDAELSVQAAEKGIGFNRNAAEAARARLVDEAEVDLLNDLLRYPEVLEAAAANRAPQLLATYLRELAATFHGFYNACPILAGSDEELRHARLGLAAATRQVLANGLGLLGVSAPEAM